MLQSEFRKLGIFSRVATGVALVGSAPAGIGVTQSTDSATLAGSLGGSGMTIICISAVNGDPNPFGNDSNFSLIRPNAVLSSGNVVDTIGTPSSSDTPASDMNQPGTPEFDAYGPEHIANFEASYEVAAMLVDFNLSQPGDQRRDGWQLSIIHISSVFLLSC